MKKFAAGFLTLALLSGVAGQAKADPLTWSGQVWLSGDNTDYPATNYTGNNPVILSALDATVAQVTSPSGELYSTPASATFSSAAINYVSNDDSTYTIGGFLGSDASSLSFPGGSPFSSSTTLNNTYILMTGYIQIVNGETLTVTHDDGATLQIYSGGNAVGASDGGFVSDPGPTGSVPSSTSAWDLGTQTVEVQIAYGEVNGAPAVLNLSASIDGGSPFTPSIVPEPASVAMMAMGLVAVGGYSYRLRRRKNAVA